MPTDILTDVIKYEGDNTTFVWKHPIEDFNTGAQLIVHESQEAVFFMNGQALDMFGPGRHTLETQNIPLVGKIFNKFTGGNTPFHCELYFINKTEQMAITWGTDSKVEYVEPTYGFPLQIGASGVMNLRVDNSRQLLVKAVGTERALSQESLARKFRAFLMTKLKTYLATLIKSEKINIFEIDERLVQMSETMHAQLAPGFSEYGVALERFFVMTIVKPEDDRTYQRFKGLHANQYLNVAEAQLKQQTDIIEQQTEAHRIKLEAEALAFKRQTEGYTYQEERGFTVAERAASNEATGQFTNLGIGMGVMAGVGGTIGGTVGGMVQGAMSGAAVQPQQAAASDGDMSGFEARLKKLELLKGKIPDEQYDAKMQEILSDI
jgi:membrane protease subunit (stomatin/prohibitin family)